MQELSRYIVQSLLIGAIGCGSVPGSEPNARNAAAMGTGDAAYVVTGPNDYTSAGAVSLNSDGEAVLNLYDLPIGDKYVIDITAFAGDGETQCVGSKAFDVATAATPVTLTVLLDCDPKGTVDVEGAFNTCPVIDGLSAMPTSLATGGVATLAVTAHDTDNGPSPIAYSWAVNGVRATLQATPSLRFTCTAPGQFSIIASVSDGDRNPSCVANSSVRVSCE